MTDFVYGLRHIYGDVKKPKSLNLNWNGNSRILLVLSAYLAWRVGIFYLNNTSYLSKGQMKSECIYEIITFPKYHRINLIDFCPESLFRLGMLRTDLSRVALRILKTNHMCWRLTSDFREKSTKLYKWQRISNIIHQNVLRFIITF